LSLTTVFASLAFWGTASYRPFIRQWETKFGQIVMIGGDPVRRGSSRREHRSTSPESLPALRLKSSRTTEQPMISFLREFWVFLRTRKKYWLLPVFIIMAIFGGLIVFTKGSLVAPFIYTIF
jgi:hypothetical protein